MGIRFESNYNYVLGVAPLVLNDADPLLRWIRVHEWQVDPGFTGNLLMVMLNVEPAFPVPATTDYGRMRVMVNLSPDGAAWQQAWETKFLGAALTGKMYTPRLQIIPVGSGVEFTENQGLMSTALPSVAASYRWWSCYVIDAEAV